jgi:hypothetical protein
MVSCLSRFLPRHGGICLRRAPFGRFVAMLLNFCTCTQNKFVMVVAPGQAHLLAIKCCTVTIFWLKYQNAARCLRLVTQSLFIARLLAQIQSLLTKKEFKNSAPKYPEKKKELEKLANSLKETDNPVLKLVRLKK